MGETLSVYRKEMRAYLVSPIPYLLAAVFAVFTAWYVFDQRYFLVLGQANLESLFDSFANGMMVLCPALAMRLWAEEVRGGTLETLMTYPAKPRHLVLGKWLAAVTVLAGCLVATIGIPITAAVLGDVDEKPVIGGYFGGLAMGGAFLALGLWLSILTRNQIVAFVLGLVACGVLVGLEGQVGKLGGGALYDVLNGLSVTSHFKAIGRGVLDFRDLFYFASFIGFFLYLNVESIHNRRYR
jgi:ABC-2 type transport system permease protein